MTFEEAVKRTVDQSDCKITIIPWGMTPDEYGDIPEGKPLILVEHPDEGESAYVGIEEFLASVEQAVQMEKKIKSTLAEEKKNVMQKQYFVETAAGKSKVAEVDKAAQKLFDGMTTVDTLNARRLYHAYQFEFLTQHEISIYDLLGELEDRQISCAARFKKNISVKEALASFERNGEGFLGEEPWWSYEDFCSYVIFSSSNYIWGLIDRMCIAHEEKDKLTAWAQECQNEYDSLSAETEDDGSDLLGNWSYDKI